MVTGSMAIENSSRQRIFGPVRQGPGQRQPLLLAAGELGAQHVADGPSPRPTAWPAAGISRPVRPVRRGRRMPGQARARRPRCRRPTAASRRAAERPCRSAAAVRYTLRICAARPRRRPAPAPSTLADGDEVDRAVDALQQRRLARVGRADDAEDLRSAGSPARRRAAPAGRP